MTIEALTENSMNVARWVGSAIPTLAAAIIAILDWVVGVVERLVVLAIAFVAFYVGWFALHGDKQKSDALVQMLKALSDNWKGLLLLLIPLFYRTVRTFLERAKKFLGIEAEPADQEKRAPVPNQGE
jgi:hypothetical protein